MDEMQKGNMVTVPDPAAWPKGPGDRRQSMPARCSRLGVNLMEVGLVSSGTSKGM